MKAQISPGRAQLIKMKGTIPSMKGVISCNNLLHRLLTNVDGRFQEQAAEFHLIRCHYLTPDNPRLIK